jgi:hypothetical protein
MTVLTGPNVSYRTRPAEQSRATDSITGAVARRWACVRAAVQAGAAYDAAASAAARRRVLDRFQAGLDR